MPKATGLVALIALGLALLAAPATAAAAGGEARAEQTGQAETAEESASAGDATWGDRRPVGARSRTPAKGSPYNWRLMTMAGVIIVATGAFVAWLVRRQKKKVE